MKLSEELAWRGLIHQTTLEDLSTLDKRPLKFYFGVDPSADSMTVGHLAMIITVRRLIAHGHEAFLLVGGATGMIGDPDGKASERDLLTLQQLKANKRLLVAQYKRLFSGMRFKIVDNYDWFKDVRYLEFLRLVGKNVPMRQMLNREFVAKRLKESGNGISYAEFSYVLIQAYDFYQLHINHGVELQVCGSDQWGNSVAGVDLIRRLTGDRVDVFSAPLIINPVTGIKFGKTEAGAVWLDPAKTSPTAFYQFWINSDDSQLETYLKIYTDLNRDQVENVLFKHKTDPASRSGQFVLAEHVTRFVHGDKAALLAGNVTNYLIGKQTLDKISKQETETLKQEIPYALLQLSDGADKALVTLGLAESLRDARQLIKDGAIRINNQKLDRVNLEKSDFINRLALIRRGKAYKDSGLVELKT